MDRLGYARVTGRAKEMIIRGGEKHFPEGIENVLADHPDVADISAIALPDYKWGEIIATSVPSQGNMALYE